jgi:hypothetical protein
MSRFVTENIPCPQCGETVEFALAGSVNADRRPDFRDAIVEGSFQRGSCPKCNHSFRAEPVLTYLDVGRKQWILVQPASALPKWIFLEKNALSAFERSYGPKAGPEAQAIGKTIQARITFGWPALSEKLLCAVHGLDDVTLELLKTAVVRSMDDIPLGDNIELRLTEIDGDDLVLNWLHAGREIPIEILRAPRSLYDEIAADAQGWQELRQELTAGPFVDFHRLLVPANAEEE